VLSREGTGQIEPAQWLAAPPITQEAIGDTLATLDFNKRGDEGCQRVDPTS
jgi:hypothetical protein